MAKEEKVLKFKKSTFIKSRFNILPDMTDEEFKDLKNSIKAYGYKSKSKITVINANEILDGWQRQRACDELGITIPKDSYDYLNLNCGEATNFVLVVNTRRNLTAEQWAFIAIKSNELLALVQKEEEAAKARQLENLKNGNKFSVSTSVPNGKSNGKTKDKVAEKLHTTAKLLDSVEILKDEMPTEEFEKISEDILAGKTTLRKAKAEVKKKALDEVKVSSIAMSENLTPELIIKQFGDVRPVSDTIPYNDKKIVRMIMTAKARIKDIQEHHTITNANGTFYFAGEKKNVDKILMELASKLVL